ncbi:hypothetical protein [Halorussus salinus]|uniref:hypothetical protein n=1 Tax=Halorussus salinus TaxID=1364935 RepID=UPI001092875E|nr:hypothetical protein [Halorussus salinus]
MTSPAWLARAAGVALSLVSVGFVSSFLFVLERGGKRALLTQPLSLQITLALPTIIVILTLGTAVGSVLAWRNHYWSLPARVHQTVLAVLGLAFSWQLVALGFLPS